MSSLGGLEFLAYSGGEWVIHLLILCSVLSLAVMVERFLVQRRERKSLAALLESVSSPLETGDWDGATKLAQAWPGFASRILLAGLKRIPSGLPAVEEHLAAARTQEKLFLERRLLILGTLGNNAPFIGLFGTVLGVIKAFRDLALASSAGPEVVMQGLSEALIATAVGLLVAIPAVMAFNYFQKRVNDLLSETEVLTRRLLARLKAQAR